VAIVPRRAPVKGFGLACALVTAVTHAAAGPYDMQMDSGLAWLLSQRNVVDGSWGTSDVMRYTQTSEAVLALAALNRQDAVYYGGISWLSNHVPVNLDASARKVLTLSTAGGSLGTELQDIAQGQQTASGGNNGWGLSGIYSGAPLDTALALQALQLQGITTHVPEAVAYLVGAQLAGADRGWALGQQSVSDPFTTAQVIISLKPRTGMHAGAPAAIANGLVALNAKVNSASPVSQIAIAAVANLRNDPASPYAATLVSTLAGQQLSNGSWNNDPYATALALRALAVATGKDAASEKAVVNIPDNNLRAAINAALGRPALDAITAGLMRQLTSLSISGRGITDLTGLEYATNLTYLDVSNNAIGSFAPISGLSLSTLVHTGDINADGVVDIVDLHLIQQNLLGSATLSSQQTVRADMFPVGGGDAAIDISDLWTLQKQILNTPLP
jgi:hypothetical protein